MSTRGTAIADRADELRSIYVNTKKRLEKQHLAQTAELAFAWEQQHYKDQKQTEHDKGPESFKPRGRGLVQALEHNAGLVARSGLYFELHPVDEAYDPQLAAVGEWALRHELTHPLKRYAEVEEATVMGALSARVWAAEVSYNSRLDEIIFHERDGRTIAWAPGYASPHDLECPWVMTWDRVPISRLQQTGWDETDDLIADDGENALKNEDIGHRNEGETQDAKDPESELVTVVKLYERDVWDKVKVRRDIEGTRRRLAPGERYMQCVACTWKSLPAQETPEKPALGDSGICPDCGNPTIRIDETVAFTEKDELRFKDGHRFTIFAPLQARVRKFRESGWPFDIPTPPLMVVVAKPNPAKQVGSSLTYQNWSMQVAENWALRMGLELIKLAKPYHLIPEGYEDAKGNPWHFGDNQGLGAFWRGQGMPQGISTIQGAGIPAGWNVLWTAIQTNFRQNMGTTDLGLSPDQSRDIAVGTVKELVENSEIPVDWLIRILRRARTFLFNVVYHLIRRTYTTSKWRRLRGDDRSWQVVEVYGSELPAYDVVVTAEPDLSEMKQEDLQKMMEFAASPPPVRRFIARAKNLPPDWIRLLEQEEMAWQQQQLDMQALAAARAALVTGGAPGASVPGKTPQGRGGTNGGATQNGNGLPVGAARRLGGATHGALNQAA